jgi:hypothetical protein
LRDGKEKSCLPDINHNTLIILILVNGKGRRPLRIEERNALPAHPDDSGPHGYTILYPVHGMISGSDEKAGDLQEL